MIIKLIMNVTIFFIMSLLATNSFAAANKVFISPQKQLQETYNNAELRNQTPKNKIVDANKENIASPDYHQNNIFNTNQSIADQDIAIKRQIAALFSSAGSIPEFVNKVEASPSVYSDSVSQSIADQDIAIKRQIAALFSSAGSIPELINKLEASPSVYSPDSASPVKSEILTTLFPRHSNVIKSPTSSIPSGMSESDNNDQLNKGFTTALTNVFDKLGNFDNKNLSISERIMVTQALDQKFAELMQARQYNRIDAYKELMRIKESFLNNLKLPVEDVVPSAFDDQSMTPIKSLPLQQTELTQQNEIILQNDASLVDTNAQQTSVFNVTTTIIPNDNINITPAEVMQQQSPQLVPNQASPLVDTLAADQDIQSQVTHNLLLTQPLYNHTIIPSVNDDITYDVGIMQQPAANPLPYTQIITDASSTDNHNDVSLVSAASQQPIQQTSSQTIAVDALPHDNNVTSVEDSNLEHIQSLDYAMLQTMFNRISLQEQNNNLQLSHSSVYRQESDLQESVSTNWYDLQDQNNDINSNLESSSGINNLDKMDNISISPQQYELQRSVSSTQADLFHHLDIISHVLTFRLDSLLKQQVATGVAAGDNDKQIEMGVWIKGFSGHAAQKTKANNTPFKNNQIGFVLGADAALTDNIIMGIAYANTRSVTKFHGPLGNDKQKTDLHFMSLYNEYGISPHIFINTHIKYGKVFIDTKRNSLNKTSHGKTTGDIFRTRTEVAYKVQCPNALIVTPKIGATFDNFTVKGFKERGGELNAVVPSKRNNRVSANVGVSFEKPIKINDLHLIPKIHFNIDRILSISSATTVLTIAENAQTLIAKPTKQSKNLYTIGGATSLITTKQLEFGMGYDYSFKSGFDNHSCYGSILARF